jgi:hypothetical protein
MQKMLNWLFAIYAVCWSCAGAVGAYIAFAQ